MSSEVFRYSGYSVRHWTPGDREAAAEVVRRCLEPYGLSFEPQGADRDAVEVEEHYESGGRGEFWVVVEELTGRLIGTAGYHQIRDSSSEELKCAEIRKMYLLPEARGKKLGRTLLQVWLTY